MKRALLSVLAAAAVGMAMAQTSFTIVRPQEGSKVRETVRLLFPMNSVPDNGYVGIYFNGKFIEAIVPAKGAQYRYYDIDTKARQIADGPLKVEAVLFQDFADRPRIIERTEVQLEVANSANIEVPDKGLTLRYKFRPGTQWIYRLTQKVAVNNLSEAIARQTDTASLLAGADTEEIRLLYSVDNAYNGGEGLVRLQALPEKGKRELRVTTSDSEEPRTFKDYEVHPLYMRLAGTGREIFGSVPRYFPLQGTTGDGFRTDLFATFPLPTLPEAPVRLGAAWQSGFQLGELDLDKIDDLKSVVTRIPARGEFVGVEWQNGRPCARLRYSLSVNEPRTGGRGRLVNAQSISEDIWFALDLGTVIKMVRTYTIDQKIQASGTNTGVAAGGGGTNPRFNGQGGQGSSTAVAEYQTPPPPMTIKQGNRGRGGGRGGDGDGPPVGAFGGQNGPRGGGAAPQGGAGAAGGRSGGGTVTRIVRVSVQQIFELEK